ncbi:UNKNOWN [Stylonychia lemnae]|uniref:Uncharacterized protein n=1 Tax=Stylonychia lemnae TaxID=5949 RepID=A0A078A776_STYLE|nr:UNKNOWN [Stylonychia lemnae]|eukprot:CDW78105.1 UNKNOWN [Stylonychia lemnae]
MRQTTQLSQRNSNYNQKIHSNIQMKPRIRIKNNNEINHISLSKEIYTQPQTKQNQEAMNNLNYFSTKKNIPLNQSISKWASEHNMEYRDKSTERGKSSQRVNRIQIKNSNIHQVNQNLNEQPKVLIGEKIVEQQQIQPERKLKEKLLNLKDNVYQSQNVGKQNKTRIIINDQRSKNNEIMINDRGVIDNSYDQITYRGVNSKLSPKKVVNRVSKSLARGTKQQNNLVNVNNSANVGNLYLAQSSNNPHPYQSVLRDRPNRKIVKLGTTQSKFIAKVQNHRSPKGQSQQIATGSVNIQIQVIDNQQHHYKKKGGELRTQRTNIGTVLKSSNLITNLQKKVMDDFSYRQSKAKERAAIHDRYENTIKQSRVQDTNMSIELSTERRSIVQNSLKAPRINYDSINYNNHRIGYDIEEMHNITVRYQQQLKSVEMKGKYSLKSSVFHDDNLEVNHLNNSQQYNTVCAIESEIDLDY